MTTFVGAGFSLQMRTPPPGFMPVLGFVQGTLMSGMPAFSHGVGQQYSAALPVLDLGLCQRSPQVHSSSKHLCETRKCSSVSLFAWEVVLHAVALTREALSRHYKVTQETRDRRKTENRAAKGLNQPCFFLFFS